MADKDLFKTWKIKAKTMLPVHIGAGQENIIDPLEYVVKDNMFYRIDIEGMLESDPAFAEKFIKSSERVDQISMLKRCISENFDPSIRKQWLHRAVASQSFVKKYQEKLFDSNNQLLVQCLPYSAGAYIPGSSIKGAVRTAMLDELARVKGYEKVVADLEREIADKKLKPNQIADNAESIVCLGKGSMKPDEDPFRFMKISDAKLPADSTEIVMVRNTISVGRNKGPNGIDMFVEVVKEDTEFEFTILIASKEYMQDNNDTFKQFRIMSWFTAATFNYLIDEPGNLNLEDETHYSGKNIKASKKIDKVFNDYESLKDNENITYLRIGRFSHLECMTFSDRPKNAMDNTRHLCRMSDKTHGKGWGKTRNLVDGAVPLGVIRCEISRV